MSSSPRRAAASLSLSGVAVAVSLLLFEGICRLAGVDFNANPNWRFHPVLGWTQEISKAYDVDVFGDRVHVEFNSIGFRDVEHVREKAPGTRRVVVLGDSFSEAIQVDLEDAYWHRLERLLNQEGGARWEVINLGVGDYGLAQSYLALTEIGLGYAPDLVIQQIFPLNDICNDSIELAGVCKSQNDTYRPYFVESATGLRISHAQPLRHWLRSHLYSFGVVEKAYRGLTEPAAVTGELHYTRYRRLGIPAEPLLYTYAAPEDQIDGIARGWRITELILRKLDQTCRDAGIRWLPVVIPFEARLAVSWEPFAGGFAAAPLLRDYPERRLAPLFAELGAPPVFLLDVFDRNPDTVLPYVGGHLNRAAHALAAREIYDTLARAGWLRGRSGSSQSEPPPPLSSAGTESDTRIE